MHITVHRAIFGERGGSHEILESSLQDPFTLSEIRQRTDLPTNHQAGINWDPFLRGFPMREWYIVSRTFPDPAASRGGMVKTFAIILPLQDAIKCSNFSRVLAELPSDIDAAWPCQQSELRYGDGVALADPVPGFNKLVRELIQPRDANKPVVWVGSQSFPNVLTPLWNAVWPAARERFRFDFLFTPQDVERLRLTIAVIPESAASRWSGFAQVRATDSPPSDYTKAEAFLLGMREGESIGRLLLQLETDMSDFAALNTAALCVEYQEKLSEASVEEVRSLLGLMGVLSPTPEMGRIAKEKILAHFASLAPAFRAADILALRNFLTSPIAGSDRVLISLITGWIRDHLLSVEFAAETAGLLIQALHEELYCAEWNDLVLLETKRSLSSLPPEAAGVLWIWWQTDWHLVEFCGNHLTRDAEMEDALAKSVPSSLRPHVDTTVRKLARLRRWSLLDAAVCATTMTSPAAYAAQLAFSGRTGDLRGLEYLAQHFPPEAALAAAMASDDDRIAIIAGKLGARAPALLDSLDFSLPRAWKILWQILRVDEGAWTKLERRRVILHTALDDLRSGKAVDAALLGFFGHSLDADLSDYPQRSEVWAKIPLPSRMLFLVATALSWISRFRISPSTHTPPEALVSSAVVVTPCVEQLLSVGKQIDIEVGLRAFSMFPQLSENDLRTWIANVSKSRIHLSEPDAASVGRLIHARHWSAAARSLRDAFPYRRDFGPALRECLHELSLIDRLMLRLSLSSSKSEMDTGEFWSALEEAMIRLFDEGPKHRQLWSRAGGDVATLDLHGSGKEQWHGALQALKHGGEAQLSAAKLIREARTDFSKNAELKTLQQCADRLRV